MKLVCNHPRENCVLNKDTKSLEKIENLTIKHQCVWLFTSKNRVFSQRKICHMYWNAVQHCIRIPCMRKWGAGFVCRIYVLWQMETKKLRDPGILTAKKFKCLWKSPFSSTALYYYCILLRLLYTIYTTLRNIPSKASHILQLTLVSIYNVVYYIKKLPRNWGTLDRIIVHIYWHTWGLSGKKLRDPGHRQPTYVLIGWSEFNHVCGIPTYLGLHLGPHLIIWPMSR